MLLPSKWSIQGRFLKAALLGIGLTLPGAVYGVEVEKMKFGLTGMGYWTMPKLSEDRRIIGYAGGVTGFFEWKVIDKIGVRSGVGYARSRVVDVANMQNNKQISCVGLKINQISIPMIVRFYPGKERRFCLYGGPRFGMVVSGKQVILLRATPNGYVGPIKELIKEEIFKENSTVLINKVMEAFLGDNYTEEKLPSSARKAYPVLTWDVGFDYETKFGLSFGMEGLGVNLGYNFAPLFKGDAQDPTVD